MYDDILCVNPALTTYKESQGYFTRVLLDKKFFEKKSGFVDKKSEFLDSCKVEILKM